MLLIYTDLLCEHVRMCVMHMLTLTPSALIFITSSDGSLASHLCFGHFFSLFSFAHRLISCSHCCCWGGQSVRPQHPPLLLSCLWCYTQSFAVVCPWSKANHCHSTSLSNSILSIWLLKAGIANIPARETSSPLSLSLARALSNHQASLELVRHVWFLRCDMPCFVWIITVGLFEFNSVLMQYNPVLMENESLFSMFLAARALWCSSWWCCTNAEICTPVNTHSVCAEHRLEVDSFRMSGLSLSLSQMNHSFLCFFPFWRKSH